MFTEKFERKAQLKEEELKLRREEVELNKRKWAIEEEERKMCMLLDAEERRAFIEIMKNSISRST